MSDLAILQDKIFQSLMSTGMDNVDYIKQHNDINPKERLLVHRRTILENFVNSLKITYPGIFQLLGEDCARGVALAYSHDISNIPSRGKISEFGVNFPDFLKKFPSTCDLIYLPDFARLEWLKNISSDAENEESLASGDLNSIEPDNLENSRFFFNSSVFFMQSDFPLAKIQDLLDHENSAGLELTPEASYILVYRVQNKVHTSYLGKADWYFLSSLDGGKTLAEAFDICENMGFKINLEEIFKFIFLQKLILKIC